MDVYFSIATGNFVDMRVWVLVAAGQEGGQGWKSCCKFDTYFINKAIWACGGNWPNIFI